MTTPYTMYHVHIISQLVLVYTYIPSMSLIFCVIHTYMPDFSVKPPPLLLLIHSTHPSTLSWGNPAKKKKWVGVLRIYTCTWFCIQQHRAWYMEIPIRNLHICTRESQVCSEKHVHDRWWWWWWWWSWWWWWVLLRDGCNVYFLFIYFLPFLFLFYWCS